MKPSKRIIGLTGNEGDGWGLFLRARQMIAAGDDIIELTIGEHDIRTDPAILEAMDQAARAGHTGYASVPGTDDLRDEVAARVEARSGVATMRGNVLITPGGQAGLFASHVAACDAGDRALFCDPYYTTYPGTIRAAGAAPQPIEARAGDGFQPRAEMLEVAAKGAASLLINSPNNPTGVIYSHETIKGIAEVCQAHDLWLISDEVYDTQVWQGEYMSPRAVAGMAARCLVIGSMSKSHAMTGSRVGWVVGPEDMIAHMTNLAVHTTFGVAGYIQDAALFALRQGRALEDKVSAPFKRRRQVAMATLAAQNVVHLVPAQGAMYLMLDIRATGLSGEGFAHALLEREKIAVMPGESFGRAAAGHIRVAMTVEDSLFKSALCRLISFAHEYVKHR